jgi:hypothetical protein
MINGMVAGSLRNAFIWDGRYHIYTIHQMKKGWASMWDGSFEMKCVLSGGKGGGKRGSGRGPAPFVLGSYYEYPGRARPLCGWRLFVCVKCNFRGRSS